MDLSAPPRAGLPGPMDWPSDPTARPSTRGPAAGTSTVTSTTRPSTSTTTAGTVSDDEAATIVWPDPNGSLVHDQPLDAARGFATDLVGFTDPILGELQKRDSRSGEVPIRSVDVGPVTTVRVRQLGDDHWYVIGATTPDIEVDDPIAGTAIDDPLLVSGQAPELWKSTSRRPVTRQ